MISGNSTLLRSSNGSVLVELLGGMGEVLSDVFFRLEWTEYTFAT